MVTPQQLDEMVFPKAVFGGYDMQSVDELLMPLSEDYKTLYKENAVLKSKLRVLVEKLEEYRKQEATMQNAMVAAQQTADRVVQEAERKAAALMNEAEKNAQHTAVMAARTQEIDLETERLNKAKEAASSFIAAMEQDIQHHMELLNKLKMMDLTPTPVAEKAEAPAEAAESAPADSASDEIAAQIEQNLEKIVGTETPDTTFDTKVLRGLHPESITAKFGELKFGKNYNPNEK